jgi:SAM-dependent methyltransferase
MKDWSGFAGVYQRLGSPLRPSPGDVAHFRDAIEGRRRILLLGVTPELSVLGGELTAVDGSAAMIAAIWPGDGEGRRAVLADWTNLPFADGSFEAVIGDGSLNSAPEQVERVLAESRRVLAPGGRAIFRVFCSPETPEPLEAIQRDAEAGWRGNLHALKWRIAMALAARMPRSTVPVRTILATFNRMFPNRAKLASQTGWRIDEISTLDAYEGAGHSLGFPTLDQTLDLAAPHFSEASVRPGTGYPLCERCPTVAWSCG